MAFFAAKARRTGKPVPKLLPILGQFAFLLTAITVGFAVYVFN